MRFGPRTNVSPDPQSTIVGFDWTNALLQAARAHVSKSVVVRGSQAKRLSVRSYSGSFCSCDGRVSTLFQHGPANSFSAGITRFVFFLFLSPPILSLFLLPLSRFLLPVYKDRDVVPYGSEHVGRPAGMCANHGWRANSAELAAGG